MEVIILTVWFYLKMVSGNGFILSILHIGFQFPNHQKNNRLWNEK